MVGDTGSSHCPSGLSLVAVETVSAVVVIGFLTAASVASRWDAVWLWRLSFLLCGWFLVSFPYVQLAIGSNIGRRIVSRRMGTVGMRNVGRLSFRNRLTHVATIIRLW